MPKLVHLIYIHGFQGNDTTFQSFPLDLQIYLSTHVPPYLDVKIQSSLYPTYKSAKPLSHATKNFLEWLQTQPQGPVILLGHSMGGLLAAEAATDSSNAVNERTGKPRRIVAVIAFDTPYLGMHPHVVISGIASLFPKRTKAGGTKTESEMNQHPAINIVPEQVTDDWEEIRQSAGICAEYSRSSTETPSTVLTTNSFSSSFSQQSESSSRSLSPFFGRTPDLASGHSDRPFVRWLKKHSDSPVSAGKRWIVEHLQFAGGMFDPSGLKERYAKLVAWKEGMWINYWTTTTVSASSEEEWGPGQLAYNERGLVESGIIASAPGSPSWLIDQEWASHIENSDEALKKKRGHHFIVLPTGLGRALGGERCWEKVVIQGAEDEVAAHTSVFERERNLNYDALLGRVGIRIIQLCKDL